MKNILSILFFTLFCGSFYPHSKFTSFESIYTKTQFPFRAADSGKSKNFTYKICMLENKTYCYDIYLNERMIIHQPSIPGVAGNNGFIKKSDAKKVAQLVIRKIKNGETPPTVTLQEMKKLNIIK